MNIDGEKMIGQDTLYNEFNNKLISLNESTYVIRDIVRGYSSSIKHIFDKIKEVQGIANKTNLLAINASIETIHASDLLSSFERIVAKNLIIQAKILAEILRNDPDFMRQDGSKLAKTCGIEEFYITNEKGNVVFTNMPSWQNGTINSSEILRILDNSELEIVLPATSSGLEGEQYKVIGISRSDQRGVIQICAHFVRPKGQLAIDGFGVVAHEAKRLADVSKATSSRITLLTNELGQKIGSLELIFDDLEKKLAEFLDDKEKVTEEKDYFQKEEAIKELKSRLSSLEDSLRDTQKFFKSILSPLSELINIARQTNLLGVRAAIEAAHSTNDKQDFDNLLNRHMVVEAKLCALMIERMPSITVEELTGFADYTGIDEFWITDGNGTVELTNVPGGVGFKFLNEGQTAPYMRILANPDLVVTAPPAVRTLDNRIFKYVGVGRKGKPGIFQLGAVSKLYGESTAEGFSVVAKQIKNLADQSKETTTEIQEKVREMHNNAQKAVEQMRTVNRANLDLQAELNSNKITIV